MAESCILATGMIQAPVDPEVILKLFDQVKTSGRRYQDFESATEAEHSKTRMNDVHSGVLTCTQRGLRVYIDPAN